MRNSGRKNKAAEKRRHDEEDQEAAAGDTQRAAPGNGKGVSVTADVAQQNHLHAHAAELGQDRDQGDHSDEGPVLPAAQRSAH
jgi:hypothetical protein